MKYLPCIIDSGGYIWAVGGFTMVHRETRQLHLKFGSQCYPTLKDARQALQGEAPRQGVRLVLSLTPEGGGDKLWCAAADKEEASELLKTWKGCYGAWGLTAWKEAA